jgi:hypothetical protein
LLPGPEVELSGGHRDDHFTAHDLTLNKLINPRRDGTLNQSSLR